MIRFLSTVLMVSGISVKAVDKSLGRSNYCEYGNVVTAC